MKKSTKRTVKAVVAILAAILMFLSSLGQVVMAVYQDSIEDIEVIMEAELIEDNFNLSLPTETLNHDIIPVTTTIIPVTTATPTKTTIVTTTTKVTTKAKKTFIFKPETHYVHTKDCYWTECGIIEEITNTEGIEARLCDECCPDIEIINLYEEPKSEPEPEPIIYNYSGGGVLTPSGGTANGPSGFETYYNLDMTGVIDIMSSYGYSQSDYWVRDDGCKMLGDYIMVAANLDIRPRGTILECSLGAAIVCDTGGFAYNDPYQLDIAVNW